MQQLSARSVPAHRDIVEDILYMIASPENHSQAEILEKLDEAAGIARLS